PAPTPPMIPAVTGNIGSMATLKLLSASAVPFMSKSVINAKSFNVHPRRGSAGQVTEMINAILIKRQYNFIKIALILTFVLSSGCATLSGNKQVISVDSQPRGAVVYLDGESEPLGKTPFFYSMQRVPNETFGTRCML